MKRLQPHIDEFSYGLQSSGIQDKEVVCGGQIMSSVNMADLSDKDGSNIVYVTLNDGLGELLIVVPLIFWRELNAKKGDVVIASGKLFALKRDCTFKSKAGTNIIVSHGHEPFRVLVREINKLPEEGAE
ncbi:OB-fold nucleic acid binding domain-containing protein [Bacillus cereus group sp. Bce040]|uniref:OB-fold nucleic acid binding domain-containing protein n=1 Tax=Bacillus cereus group sp. Bce040 TaxID=3445229 RepID=UPI003F6A2B35